jgi:hypothetical protein
MLMRICMLDDYDSANSCCIYCHRTRYPESDTSDNMNNLTRRAQFVNLQDSLQTLLFTHLPYPPAHSLISSCLSNLEEEAHHEEEVAQTPASLDVEEDHPGVEVEAAVV